MRTTRDAIVARVRRMAEHGKVTLVGHSFGGLAITQAAEAVPELIERLVYLTAYVPVEKFPTGAAVSSLPEGAASISGAILIGDPSRTGAMRINPRSADPDYVEQGRRALYGDVSTEEYLRFAAYLNPDLPVAVAFDEAHGTRAAVGQRSADVHPHHGGPDGAAGAAGPDDRRGRRRDPGQPVRDAHAGLEPLGVRVGAGGSSPASSDEG